MTYVIALTIATVLYSAGASCASLMNAGISFSTNTPPAAMVIEDPQGRRSGVDPGVPLNSVGEGKTMHGIPSAIEEMTNVSSDEAPNAGSPKPRTFWDVSIDTDAPQTYKVILTGILNGVSIVSVHPSAMRNVPRAVAVAVLVSPGVIRQFTVFFDPTKNLLVQVHRVVAPNDLTADIETACATAFIKSRGICRSLTAKATTAAEAMARGQTNAACGAWNALVHELNAQGSKKIKEPALTILREEAEALLKTLPAAKKPKESDKK